MNQLYEYFISIGLYKSPMITERVNRGILDYVSEWHMGKERWKEFHTEGGSPFWGSQPSALPHIKWPPIYRISCVSVHKVLLIAPNEEILCKKQY